MGRDDAFRTTSAASALEHLAEFDLLSWYPDQSVSKEYEDVPSHIAAAASEVFACHSVGHLRAAVLLARSVIEATAKAKEIKKGTLYQKIEALYEGGFIREHIKEAAHEVRYLGNDMAHGDFGTTIVEPQEAEEVVILMEEILQEVFQSPARVQAMKERRTAKSGSA